MISTAQERDKYRRMWAVPEYRSNSPGERLAPLFLEKSGFKIGETLIDVGCGSGRAAAKFRLAGLEVIALDISNNSLDQQVKQSGLPFVEACMWEPLPFTCVFDWFYCTDVMEHIPPEHAAAVLKNLSKIAKRGFFQIAMFDDAYGKVIGETLHLTVKDRSWWMNKLEAYWHVGDLGEVERMRLCAFVER